MPVYRSLRRMKDGALCQSYDGFHVIFRITDHLEVTVIRGRAPAGEPVEEIHSRLPEGFELTLTGIKKGFLLKRLSNGERVASIETYQVETAEDGEIKTFSQQGELNAKHIWGTGERFHAVDLRESGSDGCVTEQFTNQGEKTYLPIPFFMTENGVGCFRESMLPVRMDFRDGLMLEQETCGEVLSRDHWFFGTPAGILCQFLRMTGMPELPPDWAFGVWISANGWNSDAEVDAQLKALRIHDYPADVMVLEAWSDERTFYRWNGHEFWRDPEDTVRRIRDAGLHPILWQIPVIKRENDGEPGEWLLEDEREALEKRYCVFCQDGTPYRIPNGVWFSGSLLPDFTNPDAVDWWFRKRKYLLDMGIEGFKTDGGEFLLDDNVRLYNGLNGKEAHNLYPSQYIGAYQHFLKENGVHGVTFSRADWTGAQTRPIHWAGDQVSTWSELRAQLRAGISAGLSGLMLWSFDIGGFAGELPSAELYLRATAMGCFCPIMQWHSEPRSGQFYATHEAGFVNDRSPWNLAEKLQNPEIMTISRKFARIRKELQPYLIRESAYCANAGRPLMAHLCLCYPEDPRSCACEDQYMLGRDLLVCPITEEGRESRRVWLPAGHWKHRFTGAEYVGGQETEIRCPLDEMIALERI